MQSATTIPTTGQNSHWPCHQCKTAVYQRKVVGRKRKPRTGISTPLRNSPLNQLENNQIRTMASRGVMRATKPMIKGMHLPPVPASALFARNQETKPNGLTLHQIELCD